MYYMLSCIQLNVTKKPQAPQPNNTDASLQDQGAALLSALAEPKTLKKVLHRKDRFVRPTVKTKRRRIPKRGAVNGGDELGKKSGRGWSASCVQKHSQVR